jgi:hypothetical protein
MHGALPHPEKIKIAPVFLLLNREELAAIFSADNYILLAHNHSIDSVSSDLSRMRVPTARFCTENGLLVTAHLSLARKMVP